MADIQTFPIMWEDFVKTYEFRDKEELYTNGAMLIPSFRVEQMVKHYFAEPMSRPNIVRCKDCKHLDDSEYKRWDSLLAECYGEPSLFCDLLSFNEWRMDGNRRVAETTFAEVEPDGFCAWGERREE